MRFLGKPTRGRTPDPLLTMDRKGSSGVREGLCLLGFLRLKGLVGTGYWGFLPQKRHKQLPQKRPRQRGSSAVYFERHLCISSDMLQRSATDQGTIRGLADVAQLVEHRHGKAGVKGSSPFVGLGFLATEQ
jgi:hypothetical protein